MNERIKQLADQVGLGTQHNGIILTKNVNAAEAFEQFSELIVRECLSSLESARAMYANPGTYEPCEYYERMDAKADALSDAIADLKSQFGIE